MMPNFSLGIRGKAPPLNLKVISSTGGKVSANTTMLSNKA